VNEAGRAAVKDVSRTWGRVRDDGALNRAEQRLPSRRVRSTHSGTSGVASHLIVAKSFLMKDFSTKGHRHG
jgi:hypothetical protein